MLGWYVETTIVTALIAVAFGVAGRFLNLRPAVRHALWVIVLVKFLTPPLVRWPMHGLVPAAWRAPVAATWGVDRGAPVAIDGLARSAGDVAARGTGVVGGEAVADPGAPREVTQRVDLAVSSSWLPSFWPFVFQEHGPVWLGMVLLAGSACVVAKQCRRVARFSRGLRYARPAPDGLVELLETTAGALGVTAPRLCVLPSIGSPFLWCWGRPVLVVPQLLLDRLPRSGWFAVLTHELAHVRRRDPLVGRALLVAEWFWWWNPVYWLVRRRIEAEAELACDSEVVAAGHVSRRAYAEALVEVCAHVSRVTSATEGLLPAWGMGRAGAGRIFERRLTMILRGGKQGRWTRRGKLTLGLLCLVLLPGWTVAQEEASEPQEEPKAEARLRDRQEVRERVQGDARDRIDARRRQAEAEVRRAEAQLKRAQETLQARVRELSEQAERAAREEAESRSEESRARGERVRERVWEQVKELRGGGREVQEEVARELEEAMEELKNAQKEIEEARRIVPELPKLIGEALGRPEVQEELRKAEEELAKVRELIPELPRMIRERIGAPGQPDMPQPPVPPTPPARMMRRMPQPGGMMGGRGPLEVEVRGRSGVEVERRIDELEKKFDTLLEEIRAMRNEMRERGGRDSGE